MSVWKCSVCGAFWSIASMGCPACRENGNGVGPSAVARFISDPLVSETEMRALVAAGKGATDKRAEVPA